MEFTQKESLMKQYQQYLTIQKTSVHDATKYKCDQCDFRTTRKDVLQNHESTVHNFASYACNQCNSKYSYESSLMKHKKSVHEGVKYKQYMFFNSSII